MSHLSSQYAKLISVTARMSQQRKKEAEEGNQRQEEKKDNIQCKKEQLRGGGDI